MQSIMQINKGYISTHHAILMFLNLLKFLKTFYESGIQVLVYQIINAPYFYLD